MNYFSSSNETKTVKSCELKSFTSQSISKDGPNTEKQSQYLLKDPKNPSSKSEVKKNQSEDNPKEVNDERS